MRSHRSRLTQLTLLLLASFGPGALAQEFQPYPTPKITAEQWARYLAIVKSNFEASAEVFPKKHIVVFTDPATRTHYIFTTKDHPAHPAWITRKIVEEGGQINVRQIGYFAGSEEHFAQLFGEYQRMNEQLREDVQRRNQ
ncbi:MAG: hypothetical protein ACRES3_05960 [Steroidobacteraceae bacterium]